MGCIGFLVWRANALFNIPKRRALIVAILCFIAGCLVLPTGIAWAGIALGFYFWSLLYGCIFCYKWCRDMDITIKAEQDLYNPLPQATQPVKTNPSNNRLFVPSSRDM